MSARGRGRPAVAPHDADSHARIRVHGAGDPSQRLQHRDPKAPLTVFTGRGLHLADVANLLGMLDRLVDAGKSVIVVEHHTAVMAHADWILDPDPGAGHDGGRIVFVGTPADLVAARSTVTGVHLAASVDN